MSTELDHIRVGDCMHRGIFSCAADAPLGEIAGLMAKHRVHAVAVTEGIDGRAVGVVSDLDVVAAAATGGTPSAFQLAATEPLAISAGESLDRAAQLMSEHGVAHLIVLDESNGRPVGILSTLDVATVVSQ
ncbi:MAG: CBS domain-containing protein [Candidatus Limnocylindria bacterium]